MMLKQLGLLIALIASLAGAAQAASPGLAGDWRSFDDRSGKERSLIRIEETGGVFHGYVVSIVDPADAARICDKCNDDRRGHKLIGLEIIRGMRQEGDIWADGSVLDPETGSIYNGTMRLEDGGQKLILRGYIGIPLFGRSQTWLRAK